MFPSWQQEDCNVRCRSLARTLAGSAKVILSILAAISLSACSRHRDPQAVYDRAFQTFRHGDMAAAGDEAEKGYKKFHGVSPEWAWKFAILKGRALYGRGMSEEVLKMLASEPGTPPAGELAIREQWLEGLAYTSLGKFSEAEQKLGEAEQLCAGSHVAGCGSVLSARGTLEMERGRYAQARTFFERVLGYARAAGDRLFEADALLDLSWSAEEQTHFDEALDWADAARGIANKQGSFDIAQTALGNMGWAYYKLGEPEKALGMFVEATKQAEKLGDATDQIRWLTNAGYIYMDARDFTTAEQSFRRSLTLARQINSREHLINSLIALAFVSEQTGRPDDAKRYADEALANAREDNNGRDQVYPLLVQGRVAARLHDTATAENTFRAVAQSQDCPVFLKWEAERSLARLHEEGSQFDAADREYQTALTTFETARSELKHENSRLPFLTNAARIYDDYIHFLVSQGKPDEALRWADYSRARTLSEGLGLLSKRALKGEHAGPPPLRAQEISQRAKGTLLFYWLGEKQSYLWAITPHKTSLFPLPPGAEIDALVQRYRKAINGPQDVLTSSEEARALYRTLIVPAQSLLAHDGKVFIIPDGSLNNLNFETLVVSVPTEAKSGEAKPAVPKPHFWIEDADVANASSLRVLAASFSRDKVRANVHQKNPALKLLLIGDSVAPSKDYPELPRAAEQMASVSRHFPEAQQQVYQHKQATPAAYLASNPEQFSHIHFVAHGTASRLSPLDSAIVLSPAATDTGSFKLYARDIIAHPLQADLVTISACYGAGERAYSGEGLVGLAWAFLRAGAHNVIAGLWEVTDASTEQLMDRFYDELGKGASPDVALRTAKLSLLHNGAFRNPFYWAPFQLYTGS